MKYVAQIEIPSRGLAPGVGEILDQVNETMASFGFHEKVDPRTRIAQLELTTDRDLTTEELEACRAEQEPVVISTFAEHGFPGATLLPYLHVPCSS